MDPANACPRCGSGRLANAPAGLCPRCLLGHGLGAGQIGGPDVKGDGRHPPRPTGVLSPLDEALGPVPRVLLREGSASEERPARASSEEIPVTIGDAGRYQPQGEIARDRRRL